MAAKQILKKGDAGKKVEKGVLYLIWRRSGGVAV